MGTCSIEIKRPLLKIYEQVCLLHQYFSGDKKGVGGNAVNVPILEDWLNYFMSMAGMLHSH